MLVAVDKKGVPHIARDTKRNGQEYFCPACGDETILRKGQVRMHHFAHKQNQSCQWVGESEKHYRIKYAIYDALRQTDGCTNVGIERKVGESRPDITLRVGNFPVAIEVQKTQITIEEIKRRTQYLSQKDIYTVWIMTWPNPDVNVERRYSAMERELFDIYDALYYWHNEAWVTPYYLEAVTRWREDYDHWEYGNVGGYEEELVATKIARIPRLRLYPPYYWLMHLATEFGPVGRGGLLLWKAKGISPEWWDRELKELELAR